MGAPESISESTDAAGVRWTLLIFTNNGTLEVAKDGMPNTGGGGAGGRSSQPVAGNGGSGIVIVRFVYENL